MPFRGRLFPLHQDVLQRQVDELGRGPVFEKRLLLGIAFLTWLENAYPSSASISMIRSAMEAARYLNLCMTSVGPRLD